MQLLEVENRIHKNLEDPLVPAGFRYSRELEGFIRPRPHGRDWIGFPVLNYNPLYRISFVTSIDDDRVSEIIGRACNYEENLESGTNTVITQAEYFTPITRWDVRSIDDVDRAANEIRSIIVHRVLPFFQAHNTIEAIDYAMNQECNPKFDNANGLWERRVIVAHLADNPRFDEILADARRGMMSMHESYRAEFNKIVDYVLELRRQEGIAT